jgi:hypothetical protein
MERKSPYYLPNVALKLAIESYKSETSILSKLEEKYSPVRGILYILGKRNGVISLSSVYEGKISILNDIGLLRCYNNEYCIVTSEGKNIYERFHKEKDTIDDFLRDSYRIDIKDIDMYYITNIGLDSLLKLLSKHDFPKPTGNIDPLIEILFVNKPKSFTQAILGTRYIVPLLMLYKGTLSCKTNEQCKNYYTSERSIIRNLEKMGLYLRGFPFRPLLKYGLIKKVERIKSRIKRYTLTQLGMRVSKHIALQAYIASNI